MKLRKQKILSLLLAATVAATTVCPTGAVFAEEVMEEEIAEEVVFDEEAVSEAETALDTIASEAELDETSIEVEDIEIVEAEEYLSENTVDSVRNMIENLPSVNEISLSDSEQIAAAQTSYEVLSEEEKEILVGDGTAKILESAVWGLNANKVTDSSTDLKSGTYNETTEPAVYSEYHGGRGNASWSIKNITVEDGKAYATIVVSSKTYTEIKTNGQIYSKSNTEGNSEFANIPIELGKTLYFIGTTTAMSKTTYIAYTIDTSVVSNRQNITITANNTGMFNVVDAYIEKRGTEKTLIVTLNGTGYREFYKGTYEEAVATGEDRSSWIIGSVREDDTDYTGKYQFEIPIIDSDNYIQIQARSYTYGYWFPRYILLNQTDSTMETGDYQESFTLSVTNNYSMFKVLKADLTVTGGPKSNNYAITSLLTMNSNAYTKAFIGTAAEAEKAGEDEIVSLSANNTILLTIEKVVGKSGINGTIESIIGEPTIISFYSAKNQIWCERVFVYDRENLTLTTSNGTLADYGKVTEAQNKIPSDLSIYTNLSAKAVKGANSAVVKGLYISQQDKVDAMAKAIEDAVAALVTAADYSAITEAVSKVPEDLSVYTEESVKELTDLLAKADESDFSAEEQAAVDAMAKAIEDAIAKLEKKPAEEPKPETPAVTTGDPSDVTTVAGTEKAILEQKGDEAPAGAQFQGLCLKSGKVTNDSITINWNKIDGAAGYIVYGNKDGEAFVKVAEVAADQSSYTATGLEKGTYYKYMVTAYKVDANVEKTITSSQTVHIATTGGKVGNNKAVKVNKKKVTAKTGKKIKIKATAVPASKSKKVKKKRAVMFETSDPSVATVTKKGVIKTKGKGICYIFAYTQDGKYKKIKVKVK